VGTKVGLDNVERRSGTILWRDFMGKVGELTPQYNLPLDKQGIKGLP